MEVIGSSVGLVSVNALVLIEPINSERSTTEGLLVRIKPGEPCSPFFFNQLQTASGAVGIEILDWEDLWALEEKSAN